MPRQPNQPKNKRQDKGLGDKECSFPDCNKKFTRKSDAKRHYDIHIPETKYRYKCPFPGCEYTERTKSNVRAHYKKWHGPGSENLVRRKYTRRNSKASSSATLFRIREQEQDENGAQPQQAIVSTFGSDHQQISQLETLHQSTAAALTLSPSPATGSSSELLLPATGNQDFAFDFSFDQTSHNDTSTTMPERLSPESFSSPHQLSQETTFYTDTATVPSNFSSQLPVLPSSSRSSTIPQRQVMAPYNESYTQATLPYPFADHTPYDHSSVGNVPMQCMTMSFNNVPTTTFNGTTSFHGQANFGGPHMQATPSLTTASSDPYSQLHWYNGNANFVSRMQQMGNFTAPVPASTHSWQYQHQDQVPQNTGDPTTSQAIQPAYDDDGRLYYQDPSYGCQHPYDYNF
ncbi:hypothetical protein BDN70DRAFT_935205 [Pholiota conissans]|uniref:C2H2-type domain-containing protein n=1 Tax=Pholiota conissans TaxID=109636 RepID=A0A9P5YUZ2_9AGAR|nr:hypothetical protein BDN70DRAFT_935205 [Pholiota conissans]